MLLQCRRSSHILCCHMSTTDYLYLDLSGGLERIMYLLLPLLPPLSPSVPPGTLGGGHEQFWRALPQSEHEAHPPSRFSMDEYNSRSATAMKQINGAAKYGYGLWCGALCAERGAKSLFGYVTKCHAENAISSCRPHYELDTERTAHDPQNCSGAGRFL